MVKIKRNLIASLFFMAFGLMVMAACAPVTEIRGNLLDDKKIAQLTVGESNQRDVLNALGSPTTTSVTRPNEWYYVGQKTEQIAVYQPEIVERRVLVVNFDDEGTLTRIAELNEKDGNDELVFSDRETESGGRKFTIMQQLIGNLGRFNKSDFENQ